MMSKVMKSDYIDPGHGKPLGRLNSHATEIKIELNLNCRKSITDFLQFLDLKALCDSLKYVLINIIQINSKYLLNQDT